LILPPILDHNRKGSVLENCKSSTSDNLQTFKTIFGNFYKLLTKNSVYIRNTFCFVFYATGAIKITESFKENREKNQLFDLRRAVLIAA
jgi:hypothetical protein